MRRLRADRHGGPGTGNSRRDTVFDNFAVIVTGSARGTIDRNTGAERIFGWSAVELASHRADRILVAEDRAAEIVAAGIVAAGIWEALGLAARTTSGGMSPATARVSEGPAR